MGGETAYVISKMQTNTEGAGFLIILCCILLTPAAPSTRLSSRARAPLRFVDSCVNAVGGAYTQKPVYTRGGAYTHPLCVHTHRSRIRTDPRIHTRVHICTRCVYTPTTRVNAPIRVYAPWCVYTPPVCTHPPFAYTHPPAYTHPCLRIRTYPRIRTLGRVYTPTRVNAPTTAYKHICVYAASGA